MYNDAHRIKPNNLKAQQIFYLNYPFKKDNKNYE